jgi:large subunit ribosomal protein L33
MGAKKKVGSMLIKLLSQAGTGSFYVTKKNPRNTPFKLALMKYDAKVRAGPVNLVWRPRRRGGSGCGCTGGVAGARMPQIAMRLSSHTWRAGRQARAVHRSEAQVAQQTVGVDSSHCPARAPMQLQHAAMPWAAAT